MFARSAISLGMAPIIWCKAQHCLIQGNSVLCPADKNTKKRHDFHRVFFGADNQIRTGDLILTKDVLYRLSHISILAGAEGLEPSARGFGDRCSTN